MKKVIYVSVICMLALAACNTPFKKVKDGGGMEYKIIKGSGPKVAYGNFLELAVTQAYKDSVLGSAAENPTNVAPVDSTKLPPMYFSIFKDLQVGDSVIMRQTTDSLFKMGGNLPPFIKKGQFIYTRLKVMNIFTKQEQVDSCQKAQMVLMQKRDSVFAKEQIVKDNKLLDEYIAKNKITTVKGEKGTYVEVMNPGTGNAVDTSQVMMVNYTGKTFEGVTFDSNTDSSFQHVEPYPIVLAAPQVITGWIDGLKMLKKGAKAKFYIPSALGYGKKGNGEKIKPNTNLMFDIEIVDVISRTQFNAIMMQRQQQQMAQQKMMQQMQEQMQKQQQGQPQPAPEPANK
jgi:FKBP-type peptidyl-prolyl cis-trans isomerase FkpA